MRHLTYANVMATIAVFVALGGTGYAAVKLAKNQVRSKHIKDGEVRSGDILDGTIQARDIRKGAIPGVNTGPGASGGTGGTGAAGAAGPAGPAGPTGPQGVPGNDGAPGTNGTNGTNGAPGAAIVASKTSGSGYSVGSDSYGATTTLLTWTQPAGTVDEVHGYVQLSWPSSCTQVGEGIDVKLTDEDGIEISPDVPSPGSPAGNQGSVEPDTTGVVLSHGAPDETAVDFVVPLPIERAQFWSASTQETRRVDIRAKRFGGCTGTPTIGSWRLWVVRYAS